MLSSVKALCAEYDMLPAHGLVLCAVSGGADSMCLLHLLLCLSREQNFRVAAAHYHHHLRGEESDRDAAFVADWCERRGVPLFPGGGDVAGQAARLGLGVEETARKLRYEFLSQTAEAMGACRIATAHNGDDNGETLLLHLVRGSGLQGLTGIPPRRGNIVRPLLTVSRGEILDYLSRNQVPYVEDSTNADPTYTRNYLRQKVVPLLRELNPNLTQTLSTAICALRADNDFMNAQAAKAAAAARYAEGDVVIRAQEIAGLPAALAPRAIQLVVDHLGTDVTLSAPQRAAVLALARGSDPSARVALPDGLVAQRVYEELLFTTDARLLPPLLTAPVALPGRTPLPGGFSLAAVPVVYSGTEPNLPHSFYLSRAMLKDGLMLRSRQSGDQLALPGRPRKSVKKQFIDEKIPRMVREQIPILSHGGQVAAVMGLGPDQRFLPQPGDCAWHMTLEHPIENTEQ